LHVTLPDPAAAIRDDHHDLEHFEPLLESTILWLWLHWPLQNRCRVGVLEREYDHEQASGPYGPWSVPGRKSSL